MIVSSRVPRSTPSTPLLDYLARRFTYLSADTWRERIDEGRILCNGSACTSASTVGGGDILSYDMPEFAEPPADMAYEIVYEDTWLLGINKPGNLLVHRSGRSFTSNLMYDIRHVHRPPHPEAHAVNRLDRETSGVVLAARDRQTLRRMHGLFSARAVEKEYLAVVHGIPKPPAGTIDLPIGRAAGSRVSYRFSANGESAREACTVYETRERLGGRYAVMVLRPRTGRTHQLRVHMAAIGHPIAGDKLYGMPEQDFLHWRAAGGLPPGWPCARQALHCRMISFWHPAKNERVSIEAPVPEAMRVFIRNAASHTI
ncbi:MAG: RluA family pseudouridine synthase [Chitinivibrionales bacterium]|nr:RluA family pseudouridine synthase [Chitinivibrionales bacterium]MBD3397198.1 RluA family pseudouridine synthase [Chitinivibrionales bacterium]